MDGSVLKAGVAMAAGLLLLVPTFNALNQSYVKNVPPPPWLPTPPTPPDITPPTDMTPPPDFKPPPDYKGKVPPVCPPPVIRYLNATDDHEPITSSQGRPDTWTAQRTFSVPNNTAVVGYDVNFTNWQASGIDLILRSPAGQEAHNTTGGNIIGVQSQTTEYKWDSRVNNKPPKEGQWTLTASAQFPLGGDVQFQYAIVLPCGGLASK